MYKKIGNYNTVKDVMEDRFPDMEDFLHPKERDPEIIHLKEAVQFFKEETAKGKTVTIVGDYDYDGVGATTILLKAFRLYGIEPHVRLPKRFSEGYGLSEKIIDEIPSGLIVTVDNGIAAEKAVRKAKEKGLSVIITDHHLPPVDEKKNPILPPADILVDPWAFPESVYNDYCGAGLAYRFAKELLPETNIDDLKVIASIATVADVMTLSNVNHSLVREGLTLINKGRVVPGLRTLLKHLKLTDHITEDDYGFSIAPVINAAGRLYDNGAADYALDVMAADYKDYKLPWKCRKLLEINEERKNEVKDAINSLELKDVAKDRGLVLYDPHWGEGIVGLIAGRVCEKTQTPVIAFTRTQTGALKGSGRSIESVHLKNALDKISEDTLGYGGHEGAAGIAIKEEDLERFTRDFEQVTKHEPPSDSIPYDLELSFDIPYIISEMKHYAPFGHGNPRIRFHFFFNVGKAEALGDDSSHLRLTRKDSPIEIIGFDMYQTYISMGSPQVIEGIGYLSEQWFNGKNKYQVELLSFQPYI